MTVHRNLNLAGKLHGCLSLFTLCKNPFDCRHFDLLYYIVILAAILNNWSGLVWIKDLESSSTCLQSVHHWREQKDDLHMEQPKEQWLDWPSPWPLTLSSMALRSIAFVLEQLILHPSGKGFKLLMILFKLWKISLEDKRWRSWELLMKLLQLQLFLHLMRSDELKSFRLGCSLN